MNFGDKLKNLRRQKDLTQPELAAAMGIEQSYLSKLENGKSLPSNDMLVRITDVFGVSIGELVDELGQGERNRLRQIPDVAEYLNGQRRVTLRQRRRWVVVSALLLAVGIGLTFAGGVNLFFANIVYEYKSEGIVLDGEPKEIFRHPQLAIPRDAQPEDRNRILNSINARIDEAFFRSSSFEGTIFNIPVVGGSRTYYLTNEIEIDPWQNKAIAFAGMILLVLGGVGLGYQNKAYTLA